MASVHHYHYSNAFLSLFLLISSFLVSFSTSGYTSSSRERYLRFTENSGTIVSHGENFELGLFQGANSDRWYVGIRRKNISRRPFWVANRDNPLSSSNGTLKISNTNMVLLDHYGRSVWSTNLTENAIGRETVVAELLYSGNFVLNKILWQSFDFPTDTLIPGMKLGWDRRRNLNRMLRSWKSSDDPSTGDFSYGIQCGKVPEFFIWNRGGSPMYRSGLRRNGNGLRNRTNDRVYLFFCYHE